MYKNIIFYVLISVLSPAFLYASQDFQTVMKEANKALDCGSILKAKQIYEEYLTAFPTSNEAMTYLGGVYGLNGDFRKEIELCQKAIRINPNYADSYINLGTAQLSLMLWVEAEKSFLMGYKIATANKDKSSAIKASYSLSNFYLASPNADNKKAIEWADICINLEGREHSSGIHEMAIMNKAGAYGNMKDFEMARAILSDYLKKYPESPDVKEMLRSMEKY